MAEALQTTRDAGIPSHAADEIHSTLLDVLALLHSVGLQVNELDVRPKAPNTYTSPTSRAAALLSLAEREVETALLKLDPYV